MKRRTTDPESLPAAFDAFVARCGLLPASGPVVVAVSGGVDSMVLLDRLAESHAPLHVCHVNYGLRGEESDRDEVLVRAAAERYEARFHVRREDPRSGRSSVQDRARRIRYRFFHDVAAEIGAGTVAVGHHLDDQAESILLGLFRGAGPRGLRGMTPRRRLSREGDIVLVRPLLVFTRAEIEAWARFSGIAWREDASNLGRSYLRNRVRHDLIPALNGVFGGSVLNRIARFGELMAGYAELEEALLADACTDSGDTVVVLLSTLNHLPRILQGRVVLDALARVCPDCIASRAISERILRLRDAQVGRRVQIGSARVFRDREALVFRARTKPFAEIRLTVPGSVDVPLGRITARERIGMAVDWTALTPETALLDADRLNPPLAVRVWRHGDRMRPLGAPGSRKVSDILTDARVGLATRSERLVVTSGDSIVWIPGVCIAEACKIGPQTRRVVELTWTTGSAAEPGE